MGKQDDGVTRVVDGAESRIIMPSGEYRDIRHVTLKIREHLRRVANPYRNIDAWIALQVVVDHFDHVKRPHRPKLQFAAVELAGVTQQVVRVQIQCGHRLGNGQQLPADIGQLDTPPATMEQLKPGAAPFSASSVPT